jgi:hypothetical protein
MSVSWPSNAPNLFKFHRITVLAALGFMGAVL